ncbi:nucleotidyl transferase AbiEii/AbiGii toxin family protein [Candidatus Bipolaricaulota bacterium]|nr:nucleotidyl transferase AbiEii/AbiGii toxin family protein [Candidatus Bipolaricaulota bacterium]
MQRAPKRNGLLTPLQLEVLRALRNVPDAERFYLTGGTALAEFYLGHRRSFDLDLFTTEHGLVQPFSRVAEEALRREGIDVAVVRRLATFAELQVSRGSEAVRVQFAYDAPNRFAPPVETELGLVNDFQDLAVDKLLAFFGREEPRDAVDLAFIFREVDPWVLLELAPAKDPGFDLYWFAQALEKAQEFPDEIERWPVEMVLPLDVRALKASFRALADAIMLRLKPRRS